LLRRMCFVLVEDGILCRHLSGPLDLWCHSILEFLCWLFHLYDLSIGDRGVLTFPIPLCCGLFVVKSSSVCLMNVDTLTLGACKFTIIIFYWCIAPFISMKWSSLSFLI
jgi:hypothetical protein